MRSPCLAACVGALLVASVAISRPAHAISCGDLLIVLDRSGSMADCKLGGRSKEAIAKSAIKSIVAMYPETPMGLALFPDTTTECKADMACVPGKVFVDVAEDGGARLAATLDKMVPSCGGTPTGDTMMMVKDYARWVKGKDHFVLLITDGQPTCQDGEDGATVELEMCVPSKLCDGQGLCQCKNPTKVYDGIKALRAKNIPTFVVGFEGKGTGDGCGLEGQPFNPDTLDKFATYGGEPQEPPAATRYYSAVDEPTLLAALKKILGKIGGGTMMGCIREGMGAEPAPEPADAGIEGGIDDDKTGNRKYDAAFHDGGSGAKGSPGCACRALGQDRGETEGDGWAPLLGAFVLATFMRRRS